MRNRTLGCEGVWVELGELTKRGGRNHSLFAKTLALLAKEKYRSHNGRSTWEGEAEGKGRNEDASEVDFANWKKKKVSC